MSDSEFVYALNAMESAAQTSDPYEAGYREKRNVVLAYAKAQAERIKVLEAHIQEAANKADKSKQICSKKGELYFAEIWSVIQDWHLAALQPKEQSNAK